MLYIIYLRLLDLCMIIECQSIRQLCLHDCPWTVNAETSTQIFHFSFSDYQLRTSQVQQSYSFFLLLFDLSQIESEQQQQISCSKINASILQIYQPMSVTKKQITPSITMIRQSSISSLQNSSVMMSDLKQKSKQEIQNLLQRFNELNRQVEVDVDQKHFNLINYQREDQKIKYDPQMMAAKLRKLQNRAEINRAQREFENREKKKLRRLQLSKQKETTQNYTTIYRNFLQNNKLTDQYEQVSDDESVENKNKPQNVAYFSQLKRHPLLLEYTLEKISSKDKVEQKKRQQSKFDSTLAKFRKQNSEIPGEYRDIIDDFNKKLLVSNQHNPQSIIESRFSKFYSKKSSDKLSKQVKSIPRCSKIIEKQNQIVSQMDERTLSKENKQKLKSRLNQIITSISKSERVHAMLLPKLGSAHKQNNKDQ